MKRFIPGLLILVILSVGCLTMYMIVKGKMPRVQTVQALNNVVTVAYTQLPTNTPAPTFTPYPTVDYRATDQAYQLAMEQQRNDMIKAQLAHDEQMLAQQVELARINGTATAAGTQVAQIHAENTLQAGQLTAVSIQATSTAEAPQQAAALLQVATNAKNEKRDNVIYVLGSSGLIFFLFSMPYVSYRIAKLFAPKPVDDEPGSQEVPEGLTPYIREEHGSGDFTQWFVPCNEEQLTELGEMVVNGERNLAINRLETTSRTLRRPTLIHLRKFFRANQFAIELGNGEIALNDRAVAFIQQWFEDHELVSGYQFATPPQVENV